MFSFKTILHHLLKYQYQSEVDFCSTKPRRADNDWGNLSRDAAEQPGEGGPCARLDATLGHRGFTNLGTLESVGEGKFERSPDGAEDPGKLFGERTMKVEVHKVVTISHDEASLCAQNAQNARGAEGNKVFPGFARDNVPAFQLGTTWRGVSSSSRNGGTLFLVPGGLHM